MKYLAIVALICLFACTWAKSDHVYDWTDHHNSKELYTALKDETDLIFILYWFKGGDANEVLKKQNTEVRDKIQKDIVTNHDGIVFSAIDLGAAGKLQDYDEILKNIMQIDVTKLDKGPVISVINNGEGAWIHGTGTSKEVS